MKIAIISDTHMGHKFGEEIGNDSFDTLEEGIGIGYDYDVILLAGDIFDSRIPRPEVMTRAMKIFFISKLKESETKISSLVSKDNKEKKIRDMCRKGIPVIAIYGTHERRGVGLINPVEMLDETGFLVCLHGDTIIIEKNGEKVAVTGISGVPETFAGKALEIALGKSVSGAYNILMMHQSIEQYMYSDEHVAALKFEELPQGYDLIVNGHIHWFNEKEDAGIHLLIPGSTVTTQVRKTEASRPKGMVALDTKSGKTEFIELKSARKVFYEEIKVDSETIKYVKKTVLEKISGLPVSGLKKKPIVRIKLTGEVETFDNLLDFTDIEDKFSDRMILKIDNRIISRKQRKSLRHLMEIRDNSGSIDDKGMAILTERARKAGISINIDEVFGVLAEGDIDKAEKILKITS